MGSCSQAEDEKITEATLRRTYRGPDNITLCKIEKSGAHLT